MKTLKNLLFTVVLLIGFTFSAMSAVNLTEDFAGGPSTYTTSSYLFSSGLTWDIVSIQGETAANSVGAFGGAARFLQNTTASIATPAVNSVGTITFQYRELNAIGGGTFTVWKSVGGGAYTSIGTQAFSGNTYSTYTLNVNDASNNIKIKVSTNSATYLIVDEFQLTDYVLGPTLSVSSSALSGFSYINGSGPSTSQSFNLSGSLLTGAPGNISVSAPTNYEVSSDNSTFSASINVAYSSATLSSTPVYVRLKAGLGVASYNSENITISGGGATSTTVSCSGSVSAPPSPSLAVSASTLSGFTYVTGSGPSSAQSYNLSGSNLTGYPSNIVVTAPTNYEVSLSSGSGYAASVNVAYTSATLSSTTIYVRLKAGLGIASYNSEVITNAGGGASDKTVTCSGSVTAAPSPTLAVSVSTLTGFTYVDGTGPSTSQTYNLSGTALTGTPGNILVSGTTNYEVSLDNTTFSASVNVAYVSATLSSTPIYVRLKAGLAVAAYNAEIITNAGGGASNVTVTCNGDVTAVVVGGSCLSDDFIGFTAGTHATPGTTDLGASMDTYTQIPGWLGSKVYSAGGELKLGSSTAIGSVTTPTIDLSAGGSVTFDIQKYGTDAGLVQVFHAPDGTTFAQVGTDITPPATFTPQTVDIVGGTANSKIKIATSVKRVYLDNVSVTCGGSTPTPTLAVSASTLTGFTYISGSGPSAEQSSNVSGTNLDASDVTITPSTNYEISLTSGAGFISTPITLTAFNGASTPVYVRLKAGLAIASYNSEVITISGGGASDKTITCSGSVTAAPSPTLVVSASSLTGFTYVTASGPSTEQTFNLSGTALTGADVIITPSTNYEVSLTSGASFVSTPITLATFNGTLTAVYVRLKAGLAIASYNLEVISISGGGASAIDVTCSGSVTDVVVGPCLSESAFTALPSGWLATTITFTAGEASFGGSTGSLVTSVLSGPSLLTFDLRRTTNATSKTLLVEASTIDQVSGFTTVATYDLTNTTSGGTTACTVDLSAFTSSSIVYIRFTKSSTTTSPWYLDNVIVTCGAPTPTPTLAVSASTLTGFTYVAGSGPSTEQTIDVSGTDLDLTDVTITPSVNYEISLSSGSGFVSTPIILTSFNGTPTPVYVRLISGLGIATYNAEVISISGGGAVSVNVTCNGDVTAAPIPTLTVSSSTLTGFTYVVNAGPSAEKSFDLSGTVLTGADVIITPSANYEISLTSGAGFGSTPITISAFGGTLTTVYVRLVAGLAIANYNAEVITISGGGASDVTITCDGSVTDVSNICLTEGFETGTTDPTGWANNSSYYNTTAPHTGVNMAGMNAAADWIRTTTVVNPQTLTFWAKASSATANYTVTLQTSTDDVTYVDNATLITDGSNTGDVTNVYSQVSVPLNLTGTYYIRWNMTARVGGSFYFDDVELTCGTSTDVENSIEEKGLSVYPNPNNGNFTVSLENDKQISEISVVDVTGKVIYRNSNLSKNEIQLNAESGIYFVIVKSDIQMVKKIMIK